MKRPAAGRSAAVTEKYFPPGASLHPPVLVPASDLGYVDLHPGRPRTKKSKRKSRVNLGQTEVRKKRMKAAPRFEKAACEESLQPCSDQVRGSMRDRVCTQDPHDARKAASPCANLVDSERDTPQLKGFEPCDSDTLSFLRAKLDDLNVRQEGEKATPVLPSQSESREARAWARTERTSEILKTVRKRLSLGGPTSEKVTTKTPSQEADDTVVTLATAIRRLIKGAALDPAEESPGERKMKILPSSFFSRLPPGRARISTSKHAVSRADSSRMR